MKAIQIRVYVFFVFCFIAISVIFLACQPNEQQNKPPPLTYQSIKDSILHAGTDSLADSTNLFDANEFTPGKDSVETILKKIRVIWKNDLASADTNKKNLKSAIIIDTGVARLNLQALDSFLAHHDDSSHIGCKENDCLVYAEVIKSKQILYLHFDGELVDSFKVSTGKGKKYKTASFSVRPSGPLFIKYSSRKFPGGNYMGLGNMPYVVFVKGGYAIHGTTPGNFSKLGSPASHGCIRLHPDNAKIFFGLVKRVGLDHVWVNVKDSL